MAEQDITQSPPLHSKPGFTREPANFLQHISPRWQVLGVLSALFAAEAVTTLFEPRLGMFLHGLLFVGLVVAAAFGKDTSRGTYQKFLLALALAPLIRLLSLTMPLAGFPSVFWYAIVGAPLFIAVYILARLSRLGRAQLGVSLRAPGWQLLISLSGLAFGLIEYLILHPQPLIDRFEWRSLWLPAFILLIFTGFLEEIIFRGVMQYTALRKFGRFGLWYVAAVFAVLHLGYRSLLDVAFVFAVALFFGWAAAKTGSILGVTISHGLTNISLYLIIPFLFASLASGEISPTPQEVQPLLLSLPPGQSQVVNTPFQPLPSPSHTPPPSSPSTSPVTTPLDPIQTSVPIESGEAAVISPSPFSTATINMLPSPIPPSSSPTPTLTALTSTTGTLPTLITRTPTPTPTVMPSPTGTITPIPSHTPFITPTLVVLSPTPTFTETQPPSPTPEPTDAVRLTPPAPGGP